MKRIFVEVHGMDAASLLQYPMGDGTFKLWSFWLGHLNMQDFHMLQTWREA